MPTYAKDVLRCQGIFLEPRGEKEKKKRKKRKEQCGLLRDTWRSGQAVRSADRVCQVGPFCSPMSQRSPDT